MKIRNILLCLVLLFSSFNLFAQVDPIDRDPVVIFAAQTSTATSAPYAVIQAQAGETIWISIQPTTVTALTGSYLLEGSIDTEAKIIAGTAKWNTVLTDTTFPALAWVTDSPPYLRITVTPSAGSFRVLFRGYKFRRVI